ncbi:MAG: class II D-tagatose-bisphosphate aldolase, non-catalytic subunit [Anaerolineae bacterium]|nr:class II D-tagatose-bisphosphate aldolase, non-catalytic subunit [Anaerolineae bacterium]
MPESYYLDQIITVNKQGEGKGVFCVCSAHPMVIETSIKHAVKNNAYLIVESTSNQVNQFGGYTGMTPNDFAAQVKALAEKCDFDPEKLILGGDHLGPNVWQDQPAQIAMEKARVMIAEYVNAGYTKIHLDASMKCGDDDPSRPLEKEISAARAADLAMIAEESFQSLGSAGAAPRYIIGTEVPIPGGAKEEEHEIDVTGIADAGETIEVTKASFYQRGLEKAWDRVAALVVQPGVEFGDHQIHAYDHEKAKPLANLIKNYPGLVYEAHSTDYQTQDALRFLVNDHFAILKVGPELTFTYREAIFALAWMEKELLGGNAKFELSDIQNVLDEEMVKEPSAWKNYYSGTQQEIVFARKYSLSDRSRYYWPNLRVQTSLKKLMSNLESQLLPYSLVSQFFPKHNNISSEDKNRIDPQSLIRSKIESVLDKYSKACGGESG